MTCAYYNENDPYAAQWLRELIEAGLIANGEVDERSIADVQPGDLDGFTQCHFFAGIGGWSYALRLADWPDGLAVWTGSCPCQPFSVAGKRKGEADKRHLWPEFHRLIAQRRPATVFGEQVASKDGRGWLAGIRVDLEALGYGFGAADLCAAGTCAPHIRQRLFWLADSEGGGSQIRNKNAGRKERRQRSGTVEGLETAGAATMVPIDRLADSASPRCDRQIGQSEGETRNEARLLVPGSNGEIGGLEHAEAIGRQPDAPDAGEHGEGNQSSGERGQLGDRCVSGGLEHTAGNGRKQRRAEPNGGSIAGGCGIGFWSQYDIIPCADGKARRIEPKYVQVANGVSGRLVDCGSQDNEEKKEAINAQSINFNGGDEMRIMHEVELQIARSPQRPESREQQRFEFADFVRLLPSSIAFSELYGDTATKKSLLAMRATILQEGIVLHPFDEAQAQWRSASCETRQRIIYAFDSSGLNRTSESPLAVNYANRVGLLRGYGNAIVPQLAAEFIGAYCEAKLIL